MAQKLDVKYQLFGTKFVNNLAAALKFVGKWVLDAV